jgi:protease I
VDRLPASNHRKEKFVANELEGRRIAILAADGVEQVELVQPRQAVEEVGAETQLLSIHSGEIQSMNQDINKGDTFPVERLISEVSVDDYDALLLLGGTVNPDNLRINEDAVSFARDFVSSGKPVGVICHGPWTLVEADVVRGRTITSWPSVRTDLRNAGTEVLDQVVVTDQNLVSSRSRDDLPAFCQKLVEEFAEGKHGGQARSA